MEEIKLRLPSFWDDEPTPISPLLLLRRGVERRKKLRELIVEVLLNVSPKRPTARQLQKLCRVRRSTFLPILKTMVERGEVHRFGLGTKCDPFTYGIVND